ncbi:hypothetical protein [Pseudogemmobacter faecipullorum]|uniref:Uncharacterized protein n=1 Tax=Pseudogemmobacter faecipullorum TaxID=2755041 RepID=A0ABS8CRV3_9RHOB|nr:hypothetical protein [Pseudogemmobacter faecipullorum]MCB5412136.1 hypothetical protein [Pseudogemmobacter faecipullorum]
MKTHHIAGVAAIAFGLLTLISGGSALFGLVDMGAVVPFVLWFNFLGLCRKFPNRLKGSDRWT